MTDAVLALDEGKDTAAIILHALHALRCLVEAKDPLSLRNKQLQRRACCS